MLVVHNQKRKAEIERSTDISNCSKTYLEQRNCYKLKTSILKNYIFSEIWVLDIL